MLGRERLRDHRLSGPLKRSGLFYSLQLFDHWLAGLVVSDVERVDALAVAIGRYMARLLLIKCVRLMVHMLLSRALVDDLQVCVVVEVALRQDVLPRAELVLRVLVRGFIHPCAPLGGLLAGLPAGACCFHLPPPILSNYK